MAQAIWKGHIAFGLVHVPVVLYSAERRIDLKFTLLDSRNNGRIRYERVNEETGEEVPWNQTVKGFEYSEGNYVILTDADFKRASAEATQTINIEDFVDVTEIDPIYFDVTYLLAPGKKGEKPYVLLRETLRHTKRAGIAKVVIRTREHLAAVMPYGNGLALHLLNFQQELRDPSEFELPEGSLKSYGITTKELEMAETLVENMSTTWKPEKYHDEYRDALMKWIRERVKTGKKAVPPPENVDEEEDENLLINIAELLKRSVEARARRRGGEKQAASSRTSARKRRAS